MINRVANASPNGCLRITSSGTATSNAPAGRAFCVTLLAALAAMRVGRGNELEFTFVPIGGTQVNSQLVEIEAFLTNISQMTYEVIRLQIDVNCTLAPVGAAQGMITTGNADDDPMSLVVVNAGSSSGVPRVIPGQFAISSQESCSALQSRLTHAGVVAAGETRYMATLRYRVSDCATGQHELKLECDPAGTPCDGKMTSVSSTSRIIVDTPNGTGVAGYNYSTLLLNVPSGACCDGSTCLADNINPFCCQQSYPGAFFLAGRSCSEPDACRCLADSDCADLLFCNGQERCDFATGHCGYGPAPCPGSPPQYPQQNYYCDEVNDLCVAPACFSDVHCDDLNPCNGQQLCDTVENICLLGTPIDCDDGDPCNGREECDPATAQCMPGIPPCDDGVFCNGQEICDPQSGCFPPAGPPCAPGYECDEERDECFFPGIPTVSTWGLATLLLLFAIGAKIRFVRRRSRIVGSFPRS